MSGPLRAEGIEVELFTLRRPTDCGRMAGAGARRLPGFVTEPDHPQISNTSPTPMPITPTN